MEEINLINFLKDNGLSLPKYFQLGVKKFPFNIDASNKILESKNKNFNAGMKFTFSNPEYSGLGSKYDWANSVILISYDYLSETGLNYFTFPGYGHIAKFAEKNYYIPLKQFIAEVSEIFTVNNLKFETFVDNPQHYDRLFFESVGLGWQGKSTMSLSPGIGPWQLLGTIYTSGQFASSTEKSFSCGECNLCQSSCPTGAIDSEYNLDSRKCISYWLQSPEIVPYEIREKIGNKFYGCDDCLTSCPPGQKNVIQLSRENKQEVNLLNILQSNDDDLLREFEWFYIPKRNPDYLRRNALIALGNNPIDKFEINLSELYPIFSNQLKIYVLWALYVNHYEALAMSLVKKHDSKNKVLLDECESLENMISQKN